MPRTLLVPLDGSQFGEHALPLALTLARKGDARVHLVHAHMRFDAVYAEMQVYDPDLDQQMRTRESAYLAHAVTRIKAACPDVRVTSAVQDGPVAGVIRDQAKIAGADLIVMTTHARGVFSRFWLGSATDDLLRDSPLPLLLAHPRPEAPNLSAEVPLKRWLIPLDGSEMAEQVFEPAFRTATPFGAAVTLFRVTRPVTPIAIPHAGGAFGELALGMVERIDAIDRQVQDEAVRYLARSAERIRGQGFVVDTQVVADEQPGVAILDRARTGIDVIALGTHGRRTLRFLGSTADKVIRGSHVPVLVQRPSDKLASA
jgi:nucleotide-binding universal stress UspA family protein